MNEVRLGKLEIHMGVDGQDAKAWVELRAAADPFGDGNMVRTARRKQVSLPAGLLADLVAVLDHVVSAEGVTVDRAVAQRMIDSGILDTLSGF